MPGGNAEQLPQTGLWRVVIYERDRFVRSDREHITYAMARKLVDQLNHQFGFRRATTHSSQNKPQTQKSSNT